MNIMFRKNFHADKESGFGKVGPRSSRNKGHNKRNRDVGYSSVGDERHYRTHLFLTPPGSCQGCVSCDEEASSTPLQTAVELPPPTAPRRPSVTLVKWNVGSGRRKSSGGLGGRFEIPSTPEDRLPATSGTAAAVPLGAPSRQASFSRLHGGKGSAYGSTTHNAGTSGETVPLTMLDRDCFIIPLHCLDRFLPEGIAMPNVPPATPTSTSAGTTAATVPAVCSGTGSIRVLEVPDPSLSVLLHLMTPMEPLEPLLESPLSSPHHQQGVAAGDLLAEVSRGNANVHGMLLANMEKNSEFPFISYYVINKAQTDPREFFRGLRSASLRKFDPRATRYTASHTLDLFNEVATIARPPFEPGYPLLNKRAQPPSPSTGYIISFYKVFEGDDGERFEKNWLYWTGARMLYRYLPKSVGLRRITLHKSISSGDKLYLLLCECSNFMDDLSAAAVLIPALRARLCGYTGIYRSAAVT